MLPTNLLHIYNLASFKYYSSALPTASAKIILICLGRTLGNLKMKEGSGHQRGNNFKGGGGGSGYLRLV